MPRDCRLIVADSERNADMLYAVGAVIPEMFIWFIHGSRRFMVLNDLDFDRIRKEVPKCTALRYSRYERRLERQNGGEPVEFSEVLVSILRDHGIRKVTVADSFPLGLARALRARKIKVRLSAGPFFPDRAWKSPEEIKKIHAAVVMSEVGLSEGLQALSRARPGRGRKLFRNQVPLTAERLRGIMDSAVLQAGGQPHHTVVTCGIESGNPNRPCDEPLLANEPIVISIRSRSQKTGYFGEVTRTVVRGRAQEIVRQMHAAIESAHEAALRLARSGTPAAELHFAAVEAFKRENIKSARRNGKIRSLLHNAGHGIGLEFREPPRISPASRETLRSGHVISLAPALYDSQAGCVRLNEVIQITRNAPITLSRTTKALEI